MSPFALTAAEELPMPDSSTLDFPVDCRTDLDALCDEQLAAAIADIDSGKDW